ncbi:MAG: hypothetical protein HZB91_13295 [Elusimicrobia bacterium]|nr:hypothetical protein [Elusimicrobiota bacterium]
MAEYGFDQLYLNSELFCDGHMVHPPPVIGMIAPKTNAETMSSTFNIFSSSNKNLLPFLIILGHEQGNVKTSGQDLSPFYLSLSLEFSRFSCDNLGMDEINEPQPEQSRKAMILSGVAILAAIATIGFVHFSSQKETSTEDDAGFDISSPTQVPDSLPTAAPMPAPQAGQSGLGMIDANGIQLGSAQSQVSSAESLKKAESTLKAIALKNEARIAALAKAYGKKYPVMVQYEKEWMAHPDLAKLTAEYNKNHDPVAFIRGLSKSPNFPGLMKKYATQAPMQQFAMEIYTKAPAEASQAAQEIMAQESKGVTKLVNTVTTAIGLGPLLGSDLDKKLEKKGTMDAATQTQSQLGQ